MTNPQLFDDIINEKHLLCLFVIKESNIIPSDILHHILCIYEKIRFGFEVLLFPFDVSILLLTGEYYIVKQMSFSMGHGHGMIETPTISIQGNYTLETNSKSVPQHLTTFYLRESLIRTIKEFTVICKERRQYDTDTVNRYGQLHFSIKNKIQSFEW